MEIDREAYLDTFSNKEKFTAAGLPVGLQIVGRRFDDLGVLQMSAAFEAARPWAAARPPIA
jgi:aspartyl-tRNA(Asn)/glutamyl-tRNA(Gln) amidotransferase subunit A